MPVLDLACLVGTSTLIAESVLNFVFLCKLYERTGSSQHLGNMAWLLL
jgi:hypothetical protein